MLLSSTQAQTAASSPEPPPFSFVVDPRVHMHMVLLLSSCLTPGKLLTLPNP